MAASMLPSVFNGLDKLGNIPPYLAPALFIGATLSMFFGHLVNMAKCKKENKPASGRQWHWGLDSLSIIMQTVGAVALCNEGLEAKGLKHFNISAGGTIAMLSIALAGVIGMVLKNHYNAKSEGVEYIQDMKDKVTSTARSCCCCC
jgi:hypothetical protein